MPKQIIIIHHSGTSRDKMLNQFDSIKNYHIETKGWGDIGYNWLIEPYGDIKRGRPENIPGAHCYQQSMNLKSIGICLSGNLEKEKPTPAQLLSLVNLITSIQNRNGKCEIYGHKDFSKTACPGRNLDLNILKTLTNTAMSNYFEIMQEEVPEKSRIFTTFEGESPLTEKETKALVTIASYRQEQRMKKLIQLMTEKKK